MKLNGYPHISCHPSESGTVCEVCVLGEMGNEIRYSTTFPSRGIDAAEAEIRRQLKARTRIADRYYWFDDTAQDAGGRKQRSNMKALAQARRVKELKAEGMDLAQIGRAIGVTASRVCQILRRFRTPKRETI